jgi:hypothetical protein
MKISYVFVSILNSISMSCFTYLFLQCGGCYTEDQVINDCVRSKMMNEQLHEMVLEKTHPSGAEEWFCPICGRRMTITWHPWRRVVLQPGNIYVAHTGSKTSLPTGPFPGMQNNVGDASSTKDPSTEDPYLVPWQRWASKVDLDDLLNIGR